MGRIFYNVIAPILVIIAGVFVARAMFGMAEKPKQEPESRVIPTVEILLAEPEDIQLAVYVNGIVEPRTETTLVAQVSGLVVEVAPTFAEGGFFEEGDVLLKIDRSNYELAVTQAEGAIAQARLRLVREQAEADLARKEWDSFSDKKPDPLTLREPQLAEARAALAAAEASLRRAELDLERTELKAPFRGRIRMTQADVGQHVGLGSPLATVYAVDFAEVRLPVPTDELAFLDLPLSYREADPEADTTSVTLSAEIGGKRYRWIGSITRTEAEIDSRTRMINAVARIEDPYAKGDRVDRPPLMVGLFVNAEIAGITAEQVISVPRTAVQGENRVLVVDADNAIRFRTVSVFRREVDRVLIADGLEAGDRICLSDLEAPTDGMTVRIADEGASE
jgi:RND family efflux transporter MFP subunit